MKKTKPIFDTDSIRKFAETHTARETADRFKINISTFYPYARRENITFMRERKTFPATPEEMREYLETHTLAQAAKHFGASPSTTRGFCRKNGIIPPISRSMLVSRGFWDKNKDIPAKELASRLGVAVSTIYMARKRFKKELEIKDQRRTGRINGEKKAMMAYLARKFTLTSIGEAFGCSHEYVRQVANELGEDD